MSSEKDRNENAPGGELENIEVTELSDDDLDQLAGGNGNCDCGCPCLPGPVEG